MHLQHRRTPQQYLTDTLLRRHIIILFSQITNRNKTSHFGSHNVSSFASQTISDTNFTKTGCRFRHSNAKCRQKRFWFCVPIKTLTYSSNSKMTNCNMNKQQHIHTTLTQSPISIIHTASNTSSRKYYQWKPVQGTGMNIHQHGYSTML